MLEIARRRMSGAVLRRAALAAGLLTAGLAAVASGEPLATERVPEPLRPWIEWALLGHEAAVFLPTATMANQIALKLHGRPGDVLVAHEHSHVLVYEYGGVAAHAGLVTVGLANEAGRVTPEQIRRVAAPSTKAADQRVTVLSLENTHNNAGGRVWPIDELREVVATARELDLAVHLDGARLLNASTALGVEPREIGTLADSVTLCLSKGLGCPLGALLAGSQELIDGAFAPRSRS